MGFQAPYLQPLTSVPSPKLRAIISSSRHISPFSEFPFYLFSSPILDANSSITVTGWFCVPIWNTHTPFTLCLVQLVSPWNQFQFYCRREAVGKSNTLCERRYPTYYNLSNSGQDHLGVNAAYSTRCAQGRDTGLAGFYAKPISARVTGGEEISVEKYPP